MEGRVVGNAITERRGEAIARERPDRPPGGIEQSLRPYSYVLPLHKEKHPLSEESGLHQNLMDFNEKEDMR